MVFDVSQGDAHIPYKRIPFGAGEKSRAKGLEIRIANFATTKYLKSPQYLHYCVELVETIPTDILFASFGARMEKILKIQKI